MSLFGSSPPDDDSAALNSAKMANNSGRSTLFDNNEPPTARSGSALFADDDDDSAPWDMPTPRKQRSRADLIRSLLPSTDVPESYIETFDAVARTENNSGSTNGRITAGGVARTLAAAKLGADDQARIMGIIAPASASATGAGSGGDGANGGDAGLDLGRNEFNVLLALIGLVQEGEVASLDGVDERRRSEFSTFDFFVISFLHCPIHFCISFFLCGLQTYLQCFGATRCRGAFSFPVLQLLPLLVVIHPKSQPSCSSANPLQPTRTSNAVICHPPFSLIDCYRQLD